MLGTAALPHILMRSYTTPSVHDTARVGVLDPVLHPADLPDHSGAGGAGQVRHLQRAGGHRLPHLPNWVSYWANVDKLNPLFSISDVNHDGVVQLAEITIDADVLVLATPEIAGLPYVISGLVAAGGLAAALSTADGLLLAISNALSHDVYYKLVDRSASTQKRVTIPSCCCWAWPSLPAYTASRNRATSCRWWRRLLAGRSTLFPALVLGVFWKRATTQGAIAGMLTGFGVCVYYMLHTILFWAAAARPVVPHRAISAGIFGVPAGMLSMFVVSLCTPAPAPATIALVDYIRAPEQ
jgi:cation/acetate symporter